MYAPGMNKKSENSGQIAQLVPINSIELPAKQPRRYFDPKKLEQLVTSIRKYGILEPLIVRPSRNSTYELVAGERRYRAAKEVDLDEIPVVVRNLNDQQAWEFALLENLQRDDLNPIDETEGILDLLSQALSKSREEVVSLLNRAANAQKRGKSLTDNDTRQIQKVDALFEEVGRLNRESFRTNRLPLLAMPVDVLKVLRKGQLEYTKAKAISRIRDETQRGILMNEAIDEQLSLRQINRRIEDWKRRASFSASVPGKQEQLPEPVAVRQSVSRRNNPVKEKDIFDELEELAKSKATALNDERKMQEVRDLLMKLRRILEE